MSTLSAPCHCTLHQLQIFPNDEYFCVLPLWKGGAESKCLQRAFPVLLLAHHETSLLPLETIVGLSIINQRVSITSIISGW